MIAVVPRRGLHAEHVGADRGLGHAHRADRLAGEHAGQVALALRRVRRPVEVVDEQQRVREVAEREARIAVRELVVHDHRCGRVHAGAAVLLGDRHAEQAEPAELGDQRRVERRRLVVLHRLRLDAALHELPHRLAQQLVLVGEAGWNHQCNHG